MNHLFELGKSKTKVKKEEKEIGLVEKILLIGYAKKCKYYITTAKRLSNIYWLYLFIVFCGAALLFISTFLPLIEPVLTIFVIAKVIVLDVPINIYSLIMTTHNKRGGGVVWRWKKRG